MKTYKQDKIQLQHNNKTGEAGTIDVYRGCPGCELKSICYAQKGASRTGIDFFQPVKREFDQNLIKRQLKRYGIDWVRIGCISDPSLDWKTTAEICKLVNKAGKKPVIITKLYKSLSDKTLVDLSNANAYLQISVCGITSPKKTRVRKQFALDAKQCGIKVSWRINSAFWKMGSKAEKSQQDLITFARDSKIEIIDTPIRLFKTSPLWNLIEEEKYHRHLSPISGKLDNQRTAGLIISKAHACYSTCADGPKDNDPIGCPHQCLTRK